MTFLELARLTLEKAKGPLTVDEIWTREIEYGYAQQFRTTGKTPSRTIGAQLYVNIRESKACWSVYYLYKNQVLNYSRNKEAMVVY
ncbi:MAG TPA: winged helix-turn-helix domain-containing protein [Desulfosporosinus sp.]|nr:winged helix-turn-helix domain-containing protein [Desulfosporosinus sp.]